MIPGVADSMGLISWLLIQCCADLCLCRLYNFTSRLQGQTAHLQLANNSYVFMTVSRLQSSSFLGNITKGEIPSTATSLFEIISLRPESSQITCQKLFNCIFSVILLSSNDFKCYLKTLTRFGALWQLCLLLLLMETMAKK